MLTPDFPTAFGMTALASFTAAWVLWLLGKSFRAQGVPEAITAACLFGFSYAAFAIQTQWVNQELFVVSKTVVSAGIAAFTLAVLRFRQREGRVRTLMVVSLPLLGTFALAVLCLPQAPGWFNQLQSGVTLLQMIYLLINLGVMRSSTPGNGWLLVTGAIAVQTTAIVMLLAAGRSEAPEFHLSSSSAAVAAMWITCLVLFLNMMVICIGFLVMLRDRQAAVDQYRARLDPLTGLPNRAVLIESLNAQILASTGKAAPLSLVVVDIDYFKRFNDNHGHLVGDQVIKLVAKVLADHSRASDLLARFGGEEFVILLPETPNDVAAEIADRLRRAISETPLVLRDGKSLQVTGSFGVHTEVPVDSTRWQGLLEAADAAMYVAKRSGRNRVELTSAIPRAG